MHEIIAFLRASWHTERSYRLNIVLSIVSLAFIVVPLFFVSGALQPLMSSSIASQSPEYFGFALLGAMSVAVISASLAALPSAVANAIQRGTFEAFLSTPASQPLVIGGMSAYGILWSILRAVIALALGAALGARIAFGSLPSMLVIGALLVLAHAAIGLMLAAAVVCFRTTGPLTNGIVTASVFLGGVYYPTHVMPGWLQVVSQLLPVTYALRALRRTALLGKPFSAVSHDVMVLALFTGGLLIVGGLVFGASLRYARRTGTLGQY